MKTTFFILSLFCFGSFSFAQIKDADPVNITRQEGLPSNETYCVFKDSKNYIWTATDQGVVRLKGNSMQVINNLPDNVVFKIREDSRGRVWFFSHTAKLSYFFNEKVYSFKYNDSIVKYIKQVLINDAYITENNDIILNCTRIGYNFKIDSNGIIEKNYNHYTDKQTDTCFIEIKKWLDKRLFVQILNPFSNVTFKYWKIISYYYGKPIQYNISNPENNVGQFGAIVTGKEEVFCWFDWFIVKLKKDGSFQLKKFPQKVLSVFYDSINNTVVAGFSKAGIAVFSTELEELEYNAMNNYSVSSVEMDNEGELWFSTLENGLYYTKNSNRQKQFLIKRYAAPVQRIAVMADSLIVFANSKGIFKLAGNQATSVLKEKNVAVGDILPGPGKLIYYNRMTGSMQTFKNIKCTDQAISNINAFTSSGEILNLGNRLLGVNRYVDLMFLRPGQQGRMGPGNITNQFQFNEVTVSAGCFKDSNTVLLGTKNSLIIGDIPSGTSRIFKDTAELFSKGVTYIRQMENDLFAVAIRFGGLALVKDSTVIGNITEADGLLSNSVKYVLPIGNRLWLVTPNGISVVEISSYSPLHYSIKNLGEAAGLHNMVIYQLISFQDGILAATSKGIYQLYNIEKILHEASLAIPLYITTVSYYKGDTSNVSNIRLPYYDNRLTVNFDVVCYNTPKELQSYYRLTGSSNDTTWRNISSTQIVLENLAPGSYTLQIKAAMPKQRRYSGIQTLHIVVDKPWWQWNLVRIMAVLFVLLVVYSIYRRRINIIKVREDEKMTLRKQMAELEQTALRSQMNPHFIFNCLSSIQQLVVTGDKNEANDYLVKFSRLIRKTLELSNSPSITIAQEKEYLSEYLVLEQLRMPDQFDFNFIISDNIDIDRTEIPNMMLQPIIENSIRHGIKHLQNRKGVISIVITKINNCIRCEVMDNGIGRNKTAAAVTLTPHKSYGMAIVEKRLTGLPNYNRTNYFVQIEDIIDGAGLPAGTKVILQVPFKINEL